MLRALWATSSKWLRDFVFRMRQQIPVRVRPRDPCQRIRPLRSLTSAVSRLASKRLNEVRFSYLSCRILHVRSRDNLGTTEGLDATSIPGRSGLSARLEVFLVAKAHPRGGLLEAAVRRLNGILPFPHRCKSGRTSTEFAGGGFPHHSSSALPSEPFDPRPPLREAYRNARAPLRLIRGKRSRCTHRPD